MKNNKCVITMPINNTETDIDIDEDFYNEAYERLLDAILTASEEQEEIDDIFTQALIALEEHDYDSAICYSATVNLRTDSIEQKIAAMHITSIALEKNDILTDAFLKAIYK